MTYKTPGVYVEEISKLPPSVAQVETAIPAFIGFTETRLDASPRKIKSMVEYEYYFGGPYAEITGITIDASGAPTFTGLSDDPQFKMYYSLLLYFANGGGPCYVVSSNTYDAAAPATYFTEFDEALTLIQREDEPTLLIFTDINGITDPVERGTLYQNAISQCALLQDRFTVCDVYNYNDPLTDDATEFRSNIGTSNLKYAAAYYPNLETIFTPAYDPVAANITYPSYVGFMVLRHPESAIVADPTLEAESLFHVDNTAYYNVINAISEVRLILPPSGAVAGVYATVDRGRGVWKAPANVSLRGVSTPTESIDDLDQELYNVDQNGKSINVIRTFTGQGVLIWGARTLAGNDNEWRYVSVRRFFNMVEESIKKATQQFVFESNDANTWVKVQSMISNFLTLQWRAGALMGDKANEAYFVNVGLGDTMTSEDILEGRMIVEIGMAVVRPAEFIILNFSHLMQEG